MGNWGAMAGNIRSGAREQKARGTGKGSVCSSCSSVGHISLGLWALLVAMSYSYSARKAVICS